MFDVLINELSRRFGIGEKARDLVSLLLALVFSPQHGGFLGLIERLKGTRFDGLVSSWLGRGENTAPSSKDLSDMLGTEVLNAIGERSGISTEKLFPVLQAALPSIIDKLSPDGVLPKPGETPVSAQALIAAISGSLPELPTHAKSAGVALSPKVQVVHSSPVVPHASHSHSDHDDSVTEGGGIGRWLPWAAMLLIAITGWYWFGGMGLGGMRTGAAGDAPVPARTAQASSATDALKSSGFQEPAGAATLWLKSNAEQLSAEGVLDSASLERLRAALQQHYRAEQIQLNTRSDSQLAVPAWFDALLSVVGKLPGSALELGLNGGVITLRTADFSTQAELIASLKAAFAGFELNGFSNDPAVMALEALKPGDFKVAELIAALNLMKVYFESGKADIRERSLEVLREAAQLIKTLPASTRIEVGGHTDNRGNLQDNQILSDARAKAVVAKLEALGVPSEILVARGYGSGNPIADNASKEGRATNRRMEFKVLAQ
jgi:OOP family OmpA-OmpF porin